MTTSFDSRHTIWLRHGLKPGLPLDAIKNAITVRKSSESILDFTLEQINKATLQVWMSFFSLLLT